MIAITGYPRATINIVKNVVTAIIQMIPVGVIGSEGVMDHFYGLDPKRTCGRCQKELREDEQRTHVISIYGVPRNEDICNHCFSVMHQRVHMKCCDGCGSIQKADMQCPLCGGDTGE